MPGNVTLPGDIVSWLSDEVEVFGGFALPVDWTAK
jgi:hypothetical protein